MRSPSAGSASSISSAVFGGQPCTSTERDAITNQLPHDLQRKCSSFPVPLRLAHVPTMTLGLGDLMGQEMEQRECASIRPLEVLEDYQERPPGGPPLNVAVDVQEEVVSRVGQIMGGCGLSGRGDTGRHEGLQQRPHDRNDHANDCPRQLG